MKPLNEKREELYDAYGKRIPTSFKLLLKSQDKEALKGSIEDINTWSTGKGAKESIRKEIVLRILRKRFGDLKCQ